MYCLRNAAGTVTRSCWELSLRNRSAIPPCSATDINIRRTCRLKRGWTKFFLFFFLSSRKYKGSTVLGSSAQGKALMALPDKNAGQGENPLALAGTRRPTNGPLKGFEQFFRNQSKTVQISSKWRDFKGQHGSMAVSAWRCLQRCRKRKTALSSTVFVYRFELRLMMG